jgi:SAP domain-containing ribonucleoprotein
VPEEKKAEENDEDQKKAERAKRFGVEESSADAADSIVKGLDAALPERRERKRGRGEDAGGNDQRGAKRQSTDGRRGGRNNNNNNNNNRGGRDGGRDGGRRDGGRRQGGGRDGGRQQQQNGGGRKANILNDPAEKAKAEARAKRFASN